MSVSSKTSRNQNFLIVSRSIEIENYHKILMLLVIKLSQSIISILPKTSEN